jgi:hypothetical protein
MTASGGEQSRVQETGGVGSPVASRKYMGPCSLGSYALCLVAATNAYSSCSCKDTPGKVREAMCGQQTNFGLSKRQSARLAALSAQKPCPVHASSAEGSRPQPHRLQQLHGESTTHRELHTH